MLKEYFLKKRLKDLYLPSARIHLPCIRDLVSVVLPVYNGEDYIAEAVESVLSQSISDFELIVVDDGSEDASAEIAESYAKSDKRIRIIRQENQKLPKALNNGFRAAQGEFYTWISADNRMLPNCLETLRQNLKENTDTDFVYGNMYLIDEKGGRISGHGWFEMPPKSGRVMLPNTACLLNTVANNTIGAAFMYRAGAAEALGGYSPRMFLLEDYDYFMRMNTMFHIKHIKQTEPIYEYRFHSGSLTSRDEELGITASRPRLMSFDKIRRKLCLSPLYFKAEKEIPLSLSALRRAGLYRASVGEKNIVCLDKFEIEITDGGIFISDSENGGRSCRLESEEDGAKLLRLKALSGLFENLSLPLQRLVV